MSIVLRLRDIKVICCVQTLTGNVYGLSIYQYHLCPHGVRLEINRVARYCLAWKTLTQLRPYTRTFSELWCELAWKAHCSQSHNDNSGLFAEDVDGSADAAVSLSTIDVLAPASAASLLLSPLYVICLTTLFIQLLIWVPEFQFETWAHTSLRQFFFSFFYPQQGLPGVLWEATLTGFFQADGSWQPGPRICVA